MKKTKILLGLFSLLVVVFVVNHLFGSLETFRGGGGGGGGGRGIGLGRGMGLGAMHPTFRGMGLAGLADFNTNIEPTIDPTVEIIPRIFDIRTLFYAPGDY